VTRFAAVIAVGGQVASGKSTVARALADRLGAERFEADRMRDALLHHPPGEPVHEADWARTFEPGFEERVYAEMLRGAGHELRRGRTVVLDACFAAAAQRDRARALARRRGAPFLFVECHVPDAVARERLAARDAAAARPGWAWIHRDLAARWEPVAEISPDELLRVDTSASPDEDAVAQIADRVAPWRPAPPDGRVEAVTFDCWNTLLFEADWQVAHARRVDAVAAAAAEAGAQVSAQEAGAAFDHAWKRHMALWAEGVASGSPEMAVWALESLGLREPHPALEHLVRTFEESSHSGRVQALDGARATLEGLARAGIRRALVCDTGLTPGRVVRRHLGQQGLLDLLEVLVFSDEVGVPKPDPRAFRAALDPLGVAPERALHVGDLRRTDVAGARNLGMRSARIHARHDDTTELPEADHTVASHEELLRVVVEAPGPVSGA
jgi:putative hydrolase of the HAD superfamily